MGYQPPPLRAFELIKKVAWALLLLTIPRLSDRSKVRLGASYLHLYIRAVMQGGDLSSGKSEPGGNQQERFATISRKPQRITITVSHSVHEALVEESFIQGRSLSNLASFWLEQQAEVARKRSS
jgi:hypothetical protein